MKLKMDSFLFLVLFFLHGAVNAEVDLSVRPGDDVALPCWSAGHYIVAVEWTRTDLKSEYVFLSIDGHFRPENQHPSFQGRVQLVDRDLKDGDASLTLKNVSSSDEGTYECRVTVDNSTRQKRAILKTEPISRVRLQVTGSHQRVMKGGDMKDGANTGMYVGSAAGFLVCLCVVVFVFGKYKRRLMEKYHKLMIKIRESRCVT